MTTYVFENIEVKMTGRKAKRTVNQKTEELVEITPQHDKDGLWHKWVPQRALFVVEDLPQGDSDV